MVSSTSHRWSIAEVPEHFAPIAELADKHGYVACLIGSTVKSGNGRDLDVVLVGRWKSKPDYHIFLAEFGGALERRFPIPGDPQYQERVERGSHSYEVRKDGRLYHFCFGRF